MWGRRSNFDSIWEDSENYIDPIYGYNGFGYSDGEYHLDEYEKSSPSVDYDWDSLLPKIQQMEEDALAKGKTQDEAILIARDAVPKEMVRPTKQEQKEERRRIEAREYGDCYPGSGDELWSSELDEKSDDDDEEEEDDDDYSSGGDFKRYKLRDPVWASDKPEPEFVWLSRSATGEEIRARLEPLRPRMRAFLVNAAGSRTEVDYKMSGFSKTYRWMTDTPLHAAIRSNSPHALEVVHSLLFYGADPTLESGVRDDQYDNAVKLSSDGIAKWASKAAKGPEIYRSDIEKDPMQEAQTILKARQRAMAVNHLLEEADKFWNRSSDSGPEATIRTHRNAPTDWNALHSALEEAMTQAEKLLNEKCQEDVDLSGKIKTRISEYLDQHGTLTLANVKKRKRTFSSLSSVDPPVGLRKAKDRKISLSNVDSKPWKAEGGKCPHCGKRFAPSSASFEGRIKNHTRSSKKCQRIQEMRR